MNRDKLYEMLDSDGRSKDTKKSQPSSRAGGARTNPSGGETNSPPILYDLISVKETAAGVPAAAASARPPSGTAGVPGHFQPSMFPRFPKSIPSGKELFPNAEK